MTKYRAIKVRSGNLIFDSKHEYERWLQLKDMEKRGEIKSLVRQLRFVLLGSQKGKSGKIVERPLTYIADFCYFKNGDYIVEDAKGFKTDVYKIKKKLMLYVYGIEIQEV